MRCLGKHEASRALGSIVMIERLMGIRVDDGRQVRDPKKKTIVLSLSGFEPLKKGAVFGA